jgi:uncharacterized protein
MTAVRLLLKGHWKCRDDAILTTALRNLLVRLRRAAVAIPSHLAREYGISPQQVWQIVNRA